MKQWFQWFIFLATLIFFNGWIFNSRYRHLLAGTNLLKFVILPKKFETTASLLPDSFQYGLNLILLVKYALRCNPVEVSEAHIIPVSMAIYKTLWILIFPQIISWLVLVPIKWIDLSDSIPSLDDFVIHLFHLLLPLLGHGRRQIRQSWSYSRLASLRQRLDRRSPGDLLDCKYWRLRLLFWCLLFLRVVEWYLDSWLLQILVLNLLLCLCLG